MINKYKMRALHSDGRHSANFFNINRFNSYTIMLKLLSINDTFRYKRSASDNIVRTDTVYQASLEWQTAYYYNKGVLALLY